MELEFAFPSELQAKLQVLRAIFPSRTLLDALPVNSQGRRFHHPEQRW
jgi:hypothetical protein